MFCDYRCDFVDGRPSSCSRGIVAAITTQPCGPFLVRLLFACVDLLLCQSFGSLSGQPHRAKICRHLLRGRWPLLIGIVLRHSGPVELSSVFGVRCRFRLRRRTQVLSFDDSVLLPSEYAHVNPDHRIFGRT